VSKLLGGHGGNRVLSEPLGVSWARCVRALAFLPLGAGVAGDDMFLGLCTE